MSLFVVFQLQLWRRQKDGIIQEEEDVCRPIFLLAILVNCYKKYQLFYLLMLVSYKKLTVVRDILCKLFLYGSVRLLFLIFCWGRIMSIALRPFGKGELNMQNIYQFVAIISINRLGIFFFFCLCLASQLLFQGQAFSCEFFQVAFVWL